MSGRPLHHKSHRSADTQSYYYAKKVIDITISVIAAIGLAPLIILVVLLLKMTSPGPVLERYDKAGARRRVIKEGDGKYVFWEPVVFQSFKFRITHVASTPSKRDLPGRSATISDQSALVQRLTWIGRFLHFTHLDELPQLINILRGEMSIVGPRPMSIDEAARYNSQTPERLTALPGLTGLWQLEGQTSHKDFDRMLELDSRYVRNRSIGLDLRIMLLTILAVFSR